MPLVKELSENQLLALEKALAPLADMLDGDTDDFVTIQKLREYVRARLKDVAWAKYQKELGL